MCWGLSSGADDSHRGRSGVGQVLHRHARGGPGAQLAQPVGLGVEEQFAGVGVVEADLEGIRPLDHGIGLNPEKALKEEAAAHHRQHPAFGNDLAAGHVMGLPVAVLVLHGFYGLEHGVHGHALGHIFIFKEQGHRLKPPRFRSRRGSAIGRLVVASIRPDRRRGYSEKGRGVGGPAGGEDQGLFKEFPVFCDVRAPLRGNVELVEDRVHRTH